jgi:hypothetical protein
MPFIRVLQVFEDDTVELQWRCTNDTVYIQRVTIPPQATRDAQQQAALELPPPPDS